MLCLTIGYLTISFVPETWLTVIADTADLIVNTALIAFCCAMFLSWCFRQTEPAFAAHVNIEVPPNFTQEELDYVTTTMLTTEDHFQERTSWKGLMILAVLYLVFQVLPDWLGLGGYLNRGYRFMTMVFVYVFGLPHVTVLFILYFYHVTRVVFVTCKCLRSGRDTADALPIDR